MANDNTGSDSSPFNRTAQHDAKRSAILSQAAKLFNTYGSRSTTLSDVAEKLGLTKTSLYYYVKTKEDLIFQCYMAALDRHHQHLDEIEKQHQDDPVACASAFLLQHFENWLAAREGRGPHLAALLEIASLKGSHREAVETQYINLFKRLRQFLRDGIAAGELRPCDTTSAARAIMGSLDWSFSWLHQLPREQVRSAAKQAVAIFAHGLYAGDGDYPASPMQFDSGPGTYVQGFDRAEQGRLKQQAFYKTGTWFFNKQGFSGTSLDEIAEHLNVSKGAFYYYIKNKEDLLFNCYGYSLDIIADIHAQASQLQGSGLQKVEQTCRRIFYVQNSQLGPLIRYNTVTSLSMKRRKQVLQRTEDSNRRFGDFIREGVQDGSVRDVDPFIAQNLIAGASNAAMDLKLWRRVDDIDAAAIDFFDIFFNGLRPRQP